MTLRSRRLVIGALCALATLAAAPAAYVGSGSGAAVNAEARAVVSELSRAVNERDYGRACGLLGRGYYRRQRILSFGDCVIGLRIGLMWSQRVRFAIAAVQGGPDRVVVYASADGAPGRVVLMREGGRLRVLALLEGWTRV